MIVGGGRQWHSPSFSGSFCLLFSLLLPLSVGSFWLLPDYWVTIFRNGQIEPGRSQRELLTFPDAGPNHFIGYWINSSNAHQEAYGQVFASHHEGETVFCGLFADLMTGRSRTICGGFRVLAWKREMSAGDANANPFQFVGSSAADPRNSVEYLDRQISMVNVGPGQWVFGAVSLAERVAFVAGDRDGQPLVQISFLTDPDAFAGRVRVLQKSAAFPDADLVDDSAPFRRQLPPAIAQPESGWQETGLSPAVSPPETMADIREQQKADEREEEEEEEETRAQPPDYGEWSLSGAGLEWEDALLRNGQQGIRKRRGHRRPGPRLHLFRHLHPPH